MNILTLFFVVVILIQICQSDHILSSFIRDYYKSYNIHQIVAFGCWETIDIGEFSRNVMHLDTAVSYNALTSDLNLESILRVNYYHIGIVLDFDCPSSVNLLNQFSDRLVFNDSYAWLITSASQKIPVDVLNTLPLTIESEITFAIRQAAVFRMYDVYKSSYRHGSGLNVTYKGEWTAAGGLIDELDQYKYRRRGDFHRMQLNFSFVLTNPPLPDLETYLTTPINPHLDILTRPQYTLILYLRDFYNFSIGLRQAETWGYPVNGTKFNGIIGEILDGVVDVSITPFKFKEERYDIIDFLIETWIIDTAFIFRHPKATSVRNNFLTPFANETWHLIIVVAFVYWVLLLVSLKVEMKVDEAEGESVMNSPVAETGLTAIAALAQQGMSDNPRIFSGRIIFLSLFLWGLLLFQFYSADLVGSLLTPSPKWIKTLRDLIDSDLELGCENLPYHVDYFVNANNPIIQELAVKKLRVTKETPTNGFYKASEGYRRMRKGGFAFDADTARSYRMITHTFAEDEICELQEIRTTPAPTKLLLISKKFSPFRKMIKYGIRKMIETGLTNRLRKIWTYQRPTCPESFKSKPTPMGMKEFSPALFLMGIGMSISLIIFILEHLCHFHQSRRSTGAEDNAETDDSNSFHEAFEKVAESS